MYVCKWVKMIGIHLIYLPRVRDAAKFSSLKVVSLSRMEHNFMINKQDVARFFSFQIEFDIVKLDQIR